MGSRKSRTESLAALDRAYAAGIRWFDVAPSYGDGAAEEVLGEFIRTRRPETIVATKVGILPGRAGLAKRITRPALRLALSLAPGLRGAIKRSRPPAMKQPLTAALIDTSVEASLRRLNAEQLDIVLLHDASPEEASNEAVIRALEGLLSSGKAAKVGIASFPDAISAGLAASDIYSVTQFANNPFEPGMLSLRDQLAARPNSTVITHSVFGIGDMMDTILSQIEQHAEVASAFVEAGYGTGSKSDVAAFLADYALGSEGVDVVLMSMFSPKHLKSNLSSTMRKRDAAGIRRVAEMLATARM